jgi:hypothetical protein
MVLAASEAFVKTFGLVVTFGGIGVIVNVLLIYIAIQIRGERRQNREYLASRRPPGSGETFPPQS